MKETSSGKWPRMGELVRSIAPSNLHIVQSLQILLITSPKYDLVMALPSLSLKLEAARMTPQLQQAIKLLQLSTLDLQQEIQDALDSNLMLEEYDEQNEPSPEETEFSDDGIPGHHQ